MGIYNRKYKGTRTGLTPGPVEKEALEVTERAMKGLEARYSKGDNCRLTTKVEPDGMGKDSSAAIKEFLKNNKE